MHTKQWFKSYISKGLRYIQNVIKKKVGQLITFTDNVLSQPPLP